MENNNETKCVVCGTMFDNLYRPGGDREGMEEDDSCGEEVPYFAKKDNVCESCYAKDPQKRRVR